MRSLSTRATGLLILVLGVWGGLVPFVGHYFHFALGPDKSWSWSSHRLFLSVLPGGVAILGGLMLIGSGPRRSARLGALLALAAGIWFAVGPDVSHLWNVAGAEGAAHGSKTVRVLELLTYHTGLGAVIAALAGYALPRFVAPAPAAAEPDPEGATPERSRREPLPAQRLVTRSAERPAEPPVPRSADRPAGPAEEPATREPAAEEPATQAMSKPEPAGPDRPASESTLVRDPAGLDARAQNGGQLASEEPGAATAPQRVTRRRGGLLSRLRR